MATDGAVRTGVAIAGGGLLLALILVLAREHETAPGQVSASLAVSFAGPSGSISATSGGNLPSLSTVITNNGSTPQTYNLTLTSGTIVWTTNTPTVTVAPGAAATVHWNAVYQSSDGTGPFTPILALEVTGMATQTFTDTTTFSVAVVAAAPAASLSFTQNPSSAFSANQGATLALSGWQTTLTNSGNVTGTFTLTAAYTQTSGVPSGGTAFTGTLEATGDSIRGTYSSPTASPSIGLAAGSSVTMDWAGSISDIQPADAGTYTLSVAVSY